jgi:hypothetical protein
MRSFDLPRNAAANAAPPYWFGNLRSAAQMPEFPRIAETGGRINLVTGRDYAGAMPGCGKVC